MTNQIKIHSKLSYNSYGNKKTKKAALKQALKTREFEIELYWKRTAYFWAFIISIYVAYYNVFMIDESEVKTFIQPAALITLSFLGFCFSLAWFMVNKGSKFWQENWEKHVKLLEDKTMGPLFKTHLNPDYCSIIRPTKAYDFSVSKVNMLASFGVTIFASCFFTWNCHHHLFNLINRFFCYEIINMSPIMRSIIVSLFILSLTTFIIFYICKGNKNSSKDNDKDKDKDYLIRYEDNRV